VGRPKQFDPEAAVEQAMQVFWRKGYAATTPQDLVDALGIGKGSLYNAFGSKHALFELALRRYRDSQGVALLKMLEESGSVKDRLRRTLRVLAEMDVPGTDRRGCMAVNAAAELAGTDESATDLVRRMFDRMEEVFRSLIEEGLRSGEIAAGRDARTMGSLLLNAAVGLRLMARITDADRLSRVIDATVDAL
jgi:TetR/AcrR family transcriptional repressor of nem operon